MTAKSETVGAVAWRYVDQNGYLRVSLDRNWHGTECTPLVPESALAELAARHAATERNACLMAELANEEKNKHATLLSGLEALAGEWVTQAGDYDQKSESSDCQITKEWFQGMSESRIDCANALQRLVERTLIPAAANTESEEVNHGRE